MASKVISGNRKNKAEKRPASKPVKGNSAGETPAEKLPDGNPDAIPDVRERLKLVHKMLDKVVQKMSDEEVKSTMSEFLRLCGLAQELEALLPRDIEVTWVDPR